MKKRTKLEIYAYSVYGSLANFAKAINLSEVTLWYWINKKHIPTMDHAKYIEDFTNGKLTAYYLRNRMD